MIKLLYQNKEVNLEWFGDRLGRQMCKERNIPLALKTFIEYQQEHEPRAHLFVTEAETGRGRVISYAQLRLVGGSSQPILFHKSGT